MLKLSICIVAYNEEEFLPELLEDIKKQKYPHEFIEVVLIDSMSTDSTLDLMKDFKRSDHDFSAVRIFQNPQKTQASGWNIAISSASGDVIARIDAHTRVTPEYSQRVMENIEAGEYVTGGIRPCILKKDTAWGRVLLQTENSLFGSSINSSRRSDKKDYVKTLFHAAYRKEVFEKVGLFNEKLLRTEDNEMHYRIRKAGYKICYDPQIVSYQYVRSSLKRMIKQKYGNGYWIGVTLGICPGCISVYHLVPAAFVISIIATALLSTAGIWQPAALMWILYGLFAVVSTIFSAKKDGWFVQTFLMPVLFLALHVCYGVGTLMGVCSIPFQILIEKKRGNNEIITYNRRNS